ncbi:MAG: DUF1622 domain-containing protein [Cellulosilyticaceae bacterium]
MTMLKDLLQKLIYGLDALSIFVIVWGTLMGFIGFLKVGVLIKDAKTLPMIITQIKTILGAYILLGLEILIGADIIETIINPSIDHIIALAVIVVIRTLISFFLSREIASTNGSSEAS